VSKTCFFYKDEFEAWLADGTLTKLTTAWSRDQAEKIYVQHKMLENAAELWAWLEQGAIFYVCGDAARMALDVDKALHSHHRKRRRQTPSKRPPPMCWRSRKPSAIAGMSIEPWNSLP
jgi:sulfite reductase (NADPH) flavoprotein alpha-component